MKTYIGVLALVLAMLLSYGIAWRLDSDQPPERPSRRLLNSSRVAVGEAASIQTPYCGAPKDPASARRSQAADSDECEEQP